MSTPETGYFKGEGGVVWEMTLPLPEYMAEKVTKGYLFRVNADGSPWVDPQADPQKPAAGLEPLPADSARKPEWVGWAVRNLGMRPDDAEALTRHDLMDKAKAKLAATPQAGDA